MRSQPPFGIEDLTLVRRIGEGGFGTVYEAVQTTMDRTVALKVGNAAIAADADARAFTVEATTLARAGDHPNVITVHDAGVSSSGHPYLVMEFAAGGSLGAAVAAGRRLAGDDLARVGADLAAALAHTHSVGVVHRDVKPANVLLTATGVVKLADFGVAAFTVDRDLQHAATVGFVPPEVADGRPAGPPADQWALAATLVAAATGTPPIPDVALVDLGVDPSVAGVLERALRTDPAARWPDCHSFETALRSTVTSPAPAAEAATSGAALVSPAALTTLLGADHRRRRRRRRAGLLAAAAAGGILVVGGGLVWAGGGNAHELNADTPAVDSAAPESASSSTGNGNTSGTDQGDASVDDGDIASTPDTASPVFLTESTAGGPTSSTSVVAPASGAPPDAGFGNPVVATPPPVTIAPESDPVVTPPRGTNPPATSPHVNATSPPATQPPTPSPTPSPTPAATTPPTPPPTSPPTTTRAPTTTRPATAPGAPAAVAVTSATVASWVNPTFEDVGSVNVSLSWQAAANGGATINGHRVRLTFVERATGNIYGTPTVTAVGPATSTTITASKPGANVYARWEVAAVNAVGTGAYAPVGSWTTPNLLEFTYYYPAYHLVTMAGGVVNAHAFTTAGHTGTLDDNVYGQDLPPGSPQPPGAVVRVWWRSAGDCVGFAPPAGGCNLAAPPAVVHHK